MRRQIVLVCALLAVSSLLRAQSATNTNAKEFTCFGDIAPPAGSALAKQGNDPWIELQRFIPEQQALKQATAIEVLTRPKASLQRDLLLTRLAYRTLDKPSAASTAAFLAASDGSALDYVEVIAANDFPATRVDALLSSALQRKQTAQDHTLGLRRASNYVQARIAHHLRQQNSAAPSDEHVEACISAIAVSALPRIEKWVQACRGDALKTSKKRASLCAQVAKQLERQADSLAIVLISTAVQGHTAQGAVELAKAAQTKDDWQALGEALQLVGLTENAPAELGLSLSRSLEHGEVNSLLRTPEHLPGLAPAIFNRLRAVRGIK